MDNGGHVVLALDIELRGGRLVLDVLDKVFLGGMAALDLQVRQMKTAWSHESVLVRSGFVMSMSTLSAEVRETSV